MDEIASAPSSFDGLVGTASDDDDITVSVLRDGGRVTVAVKGEIDLMTVARLSDTLSSEIARGPTLLVVDLDGVGFLASMGITALALADRDAGERGIGFRVVASNRNTLRPLEITGMSGMLDIYASRDEALSAPPPSSRPHRDH